VQFLMAITGLCERGADEEADRHHLTFLQNGRRLRLFVYESGRPIRRSIIDLLRVSAERLHRLSRVNDRTETTHV
jgi:hypothetical protein